jgi:NTE family protein
MTVPDAGGETPKKIGLVLAGGGARGAYELGVLRQLLPWLAARLKEEPGWPDDIDVETWRPHIIVGTSVGALNAAFLAATADRLLEDALREGCEVWQQINWGKAVEDLISISSAKEGVSAFLDFFKFPGAHARRLLDPSPLRRTLTEGKLTDELTDGIPFEKIPRNVRESKELEAAAVVTTLASTSLTRVFYDGRAKKPDRDERRGVEYVPATLEVDHVLASAAIPSVFPPVKVGQEWYYDGGTRLNTPIKPAIDLGATHLIVVSLHSLELGEVKPSGEPELLDGAKQLIQGLLIDPLVNDLHTLADINDIVAAMSGKSQKREVRLPPDPPARPHEKRYSEIPYIVVAPKLRGIGECAVKVYEKRGGALPDNVSLLGWGLDIDGDSSRGELFSYLFFDEDFGSALVELGGADATKLIGRIERDELPLWQTGPPSP